MSLRAILIGLLLVIVICGFNYLGSSVFGLPSMINGGMAGLVFGTLVVLILAVNPVLAWAYPRGMFKWSELALILAIGASVCCYAGATCFRYFTTLMALPAHAAQTRTHWHATRVLSYVPGHIGYVATGQLRHPVALTERVIAERDLDTAAGRLWHLATDPDRQLWERVHAARDAVHADEQFRAQITEAVNRVLADPRFVEGRAYEGRSALQSGRLWLQAEMPEVFSPPPSGEGVLLNNGVYDSTIMGQVFLGANHGRIPSPAEVPWEAWWPIIRLWGGLAILLVLTAICLSVVVRPQWADHERLAFPLVRFVELMAHRESERGLPSMARSKLFWCGFSVIVVHLINGLHTWFPHLPHIPMQLDFSPLRQLFPYASQGWRAAGLFEPYLFLTVVAFAFLLPTSISLTFGVTNLICVIVAAQLLARGIDATGGAVRIAWFDLMSLGAMLGMVLTVLYVGRSYYMRVAVAAAGFGVPGSFRAPPAAVWGLRATLVLIPLSIYHLMGSGISPFFAVFGVGMVLLLWFVAARIVCETGLFHLGSLILPVTAATAFFGDAGLGPTNIILLTMIGVLLATDLMESPMQFMMTGLETTKRAGLAAGRVAPGLMATTVLGFVIAVVATLAVNHRYGILTLGDPAVPYRGTLGQELAASVAARLPTDQLVRSVEASTLERLGQFELRGWVLGWAGAGLLFFASFTVLRLRVPGWPLHPVLFVLLGNWGIMMYGASFFLGWMIKASVVRLAGEKGYHLVLPLMCGVVTAGLTSGLGWFIAGFIYFVLTGQRPPGGGSQ